MSKFYECTVSITEISTEKVPFRCTLTGLSEEKKRSDRRFLYIFF